MSMAAAMQQHRVPISAFSSMKMAVPRSSKAMARSWCRARIRWRTSTRRITSGESTWTTEFCLPEAALGGGEHGLRIMFTVELPQTIGDSLIFRWPAAANANSPATWAPVQLGDLPAAANGAAHCAGWRRSRGRSRGGQHHHAGWQREPRSRGPAAHLSVDANRRPDDYPAQLRERAAIFHGDARYDTDYLALPAHRE